MSLEGILLPQADLLQTDRQAMLQLMQQFYDHVDDSAFYSDLQDKDSCILLRDEAGTLRGFSTQKRMILTAAGCRVEGIFSGDTIIHPGSWGSLELHRVFARHFIAPGGELYWFLISKGYRTYKMLPAFFRSYYPSCLWPVPEWERHIMDAFGCAYHPEAYNPRTGVMEYPRPKDRLRDGVAGITPRLAKDKHIAWFLEHNPGWEQGNDLVCLTMLRRDNLLPRTRKLLFGDEERIHD